ncbi:MAG: VIT and VWA domain-containing protein [Sheuella sp.]|nr:VIT and VWA domain-containing protein [Sheuella sp.]
MSRNDSASRAQLQTRSGEPMLLKNVSVSGDLRGALFEAEIRQEFTNPTDKHAEVIYSFPLPWGATLLGVEVMLGDKRLSGNVIEKKKAESRYEETLSKGDAAIMLERGEDGHYVLNLGNLAPAEDCVVTINYGQMLRFEQGGLRLLIPTVIAPRFGDLVKDGGLASHQVPETNLLSEYGFGLELRLHGELAHVRVASPSHPIRVGSASGAVLTISLGKESALDRDFILVMDQLTQTSLATVSADYAKPESYVIAASFKPSLGEAAAHPLALKILVDCSGSMAGDSIMAARRALHEIVSRLSEGDKYSLSKFGSEVQHRTRSLWATTETSLVAARRWVSELDADMGGTEMEEALRSTFLLTEDEACDLLLITDGEISAVQGVIRAAKQSKHRVFVVGIGSSPSEGLIRELAEQTGGACDFVAPGEDVDPAILRMFARLRTPLVSNLSVQWPEGCQPEWVSALGNAVFDGDTLHVFATVTARPVGELRLSGTVISNNVPGNTLLGTAVFQAVNDSTEILGNSLSRLAASVRLNETIDKKMKVRLALDYQLVTPLTNFLMEHVRADGEKATDMPVLRKVAQMMPAGYGGMGTVDYGIPSVIRNVSYRMRMPSSMVCSEEKIEDMFDIPAFLRRGVAPTIEKSTVLRAMATPKKKKQNAGIVKSLKDALGLSTPAKDEFSDLIVTPLELRAWLNDHESKSWPKSIGDLMDVALPTDITDWLTQLDTGVAKVVHPKPNVIRLFLEIIAIYPLAKISGLATQQQVFIERYYKLYPERQLVDLNSPSSTAHQVLLKVILEKLVTITSDKWPGVEVDAALSK